jgi:hypothetical protein
MGGYANRKLMLGSHNEYYDIIDEMLSPNFIGSIHTDTNLINGKMNFNCSTLPHNDATACQNNVGVAQFRLDMGKTHLLSLINSGTDALQTFSIDGNHMTVISNDLAPNRPA